MSASSRPESRRLTMVKKECWGRERQRSRKLGGVMGNGCADRLISGPGCRPPSRLVVVYVKGLFEDQLDIQSSSLREVTFIMHHLQLVAVSVHEAHKNKKMIASRTRHVPSKIMSIDLPNSKDQPSVCQSTGAHFAQQRVRVLFQNHLSPCPARPCLVHVATVKR